MALSDLLRLRSAGLLLHPTSLPGPFGVGDLGMEAHRFAERLANAGVSWWQMLPLGPPGGGESPYNALSAFAGNPMLISPELLVQDGLLAPEQIDAIREPSQSRVHWPSAIARKQKLLSQAFERFRTSPSPELHLSLEAFVARKGEAWLHDYALFASLRDELGHRGLPDWPHELRTKDAAALHQARARLEFQIARHEFAQFLFERQWQALRSHCQKLGLHLLGDVPIFVARDSADVWAHPEVFRLDADGQPLVVAGVPPDYFSEDGQLWGNPLYDWAHLKETGYRWWIERFRSLLTRFDAARVDHFIGFYRAWQIPRDSKTAKVGEFVPGPRSDFFVALKDALGGLPIVAEDLGILTDEVRALRDEFGFPGLKVLQFGFTPEGHETEHQPHTFPENCVVYTGTHDNDTTAGWWAQLGRTAASKDPEEEAEAAAAAGVRRSVLGYLGAQDDHEIHWKLIEVALQSKAKIAIFPVQDLLGQGSEHRMNRPGLAEGNWAYRLEPGSLDDATLRRLADAIERSKRAPAPHGPR